MLVIVGLPTALQPYQAFDIATTRLSEMMLGAAVRRRGQRCTVSHDLSDALLLTVCKRCADFKTFIALAPLILDNTWLTTTKEYSGIGTGGLLFFFSYADIGSSYPFDILELLNGMSGGLIGVTVAWIMYQIIDPSDSRWIKLRFVLAL